MVIATALLRMDIQKINRIPYDMEEEERGKVLRARVRKLLQDLFTVTCCIFFSHDLVLQTLTV